jgi:transposase-like protein
MPRRKRDRRFVLISTVAERYGIHPQTLRLYVNLAGVEVILNMREEMARMQIEVDRLLDYVRQEMIDRKHGVARQHALVRIGPAPLAKR